MKQPEIEIDHIGIAVESLAELGFWELLGLDKEVALKMLWSRRSMSKSFL